MTAHIARMLHLDSHYHRVFDSLGICGAVGPHALEPTCPNCRRLIAQEVDAEIEQMRRIGGLASRLAPGYTLPHGSPDVDAYLSRPLATTPCLDGSTERCVPMATSDGIVCVYCKREIRS